ncbi:unnamed protein product, partial [Mesorhabditis belari]|uniref:Protein artemis n=1 Tax=Mesorhabditis belari TaxID=2138241 RepID=A0AAF3EJX8_9BILA
MSETRKRKRTRFSEDVEFYEYQGDFDESRGDLQRYSTMVAIRQMREEAQRKEAEVAARNRMSETLDESRTSVNKSLKADSPSSSKRSLLDAVCGMLFSVDNFNRYSRKAFYFLTHGHSDHYGSLSYTWKRQIYCSEKTAELLPYLTSRKNRTGTLGAGISKQLLHSIPLGIAQDLGNFTITLLDANHCPGSAMLYFKGNDEIFAQGPILFTGDFRADRTLFERFDSDPNYQELTQVELGHVFIDDTYLWDETSSFPPRDELFPRIYETIRWIPRNYRILFPLHKLGKENALIKIAKYTGEKIALDAGRWSVRESLFSPEELQHFVEPEENSSTVRIHVCLRRLTGDLYEAYGKKAFKCKVINLTMQRKTLSRRIPEENIFSFPYSDHSSFEEIHRFLSRLRIKNLHPWSNRDVKDDERWKILLQACAVDKSTTSSTNALHEVLAQNLRESLEALPIETIPFLEADGLALNRLAPPLDAASTPYSTMPLGIDWTNRVLREKA